MNLYNPLTTIKKEDRLGHPYKGVVVQVTDESQIGRIKVSIPELFGEYVEESEEKNSAGILPWIYPRFYGSFNQSFSVPEKGDIVEVEFLFNNIYLGYYTNKPLFKGKLHEVFTTENYPNVYGNMDSNNTGWYVDKVTDTITIVQGTTQDSIIIDNEGSITFNILKNVVFNVGEKFIINSGTSVEINTPNMISTIEEDFNVASSTITMKGTTGITGDTTITGNLDVSDTIKGATDVIAAGSISLKGHVHVCAAAGSPSGPPK